MMRIPFVIIAMAEGDDKEYMEWLYTEHRLLMYGIAWRYVDDTHQAEDVVSDSCVALMRKISVLRGLDGFALRKYIVSCVRNTAFNSNESRKRQRNLFAQSYGEADGMPDESAGIEDHGASEDRCEHFQGSGLHPDNCCTGNADCYCKS